MRILWIAADVLEPFFPFVKGNPTRGGSWIDPLFFSLGADVNIEMAILSPVVNGEYQKRTIEGFTHYVVPVGKNSATKRFTEQMIANYLTAIKDFKPDLIHVHGTEKNFGLLRKDINRSIPIVVSIQGIIGSYVPYLQASVSGICIRKFKSIKNRLFKGGVESNIASWIKYSILEEEIIKINKYFIGRTSWDQAQVKAVNSDAYYYHGEELLRESFYGKVWKPEKCIKHNVFVSSAAYPLKGFHVALKAIALLKPKYPNIKLVAPLSSLNFNSSPVWDFFFAEDYARYLKSEISKLGLKDNIQILKRLNSDEMANCFLDANVFVLSSFIENSPNSLGEAMMIGTPTVVSPVGGVMSILADKEDTLMFPAGDHATLAFQLDILFSDMELACKLSESSKKIAKNRHSVAQATNQYINAYKRIITLHNENSTSIC